MRRSFAIILLLAAMPLAGADVEIGVRHLSMWPAGEGARDAGSIDVVSSRGFGVGAEVFWTPAFSTQLAGTFFNPAAFLESPEGTVDLNTLGIDTWSLSARYDLAPEARWSGFAGAGVALVSFGNLEERFGDTLEIELENHATWLAEGGIRYRYRPRLTLDVAVAWMPVEGKARSIRNDGPHPAPPSSVRLDPVTLSVGAAWRF
jgi:outer membrane protein W